ncbi:MAG TPA: ATP-binding cassette domain-containing protein [Dehalococcoidia bacterium]|nr:ATP-binding cassette domain-containing protein [Dehalococcoidia bacterium]
MKEDGDAVGCEDVWFAYRRDAWVLRGVTLSVAPGGFVAILGRSGSGKTTLVKVLAGLMQPDRGAVRLLGQDVSRGTPPGLRRRVGYIPQQLGLVRSLSALDNTLMGLLGRRKGLATLAGLFPSADIAQARWWLERLSIGHKASEPVYRLSGGERQRVAIARTMLQGPEIVFADEFVSDLDLPRAAEILALMRSISEDQGITFVVNLHDLPLVREFGGRALVLDEGRIVLDLPAAEVSHTTLEAALR